MMSPALGRLLPPLSALLMAGVLLLGCGGCEYDVGAPPRASSTSSDPSLPPSFTAFPTLDPEVAAAQDRNAAIMRRHLAVAAPDLISGADGPADGVSTSTKALPSGKYIVASECLGASEAELVVVGTGGAVLLQTTYLCGEPVVHELDAAGALSISTRVTGEKPAPGAGARVGFHLGRATAPQATPSPEFRR
ncbi:hypothetical protein [Arthrobacter sp. R4-81]